MYFNIKRREDLLKVLDAYQEKWQNEPLADLIDQEVSKIKFLSLQYLFYRDKESFSAIKDTVNNLKSLTKDAAEPSEKLEQFYNKIIISTFGNEAYEATPRQASITARNVVSTLTELMLDQVKTTKDTSQKSNEEIIEQLCHWRNEDPNHFISNLKEKSALIRTTLSEISNQNNQAEKPIQLKQNFATAQQNHLASIEQIFQLHYQYENLKELYIQHINQSKHYPNFSIAEHNSLQEYAVTILRGFTLETLRQESSELKIAEQYKSEINNLEQKLNSNKEGKENSNQSNAPKEPRQNRSPLSSTKENLNTNTSHAFVNKTTFRSANSSELSI